MAPPAADSARAFVDEFASTEEFRRGGHGALRTQELRARFEGLRGARQAPTSYRAPYAWDERPVPSGPARSYGPGGDIRPPPAGQRN